MRTDSRKRRSLRPRPPWPPKEPSLALACDAEGPRSASVNRPVPLDLRAQRERRRVVIPPFVDRDRDRDRPASSTRRAAGYRPLLPGHNSRGPHSVSFTDQTNGECLGERPKNTEEPDAHGNVDHPRSIGAAWLNLRSGPAQYAQRMRTFRSGRTGRIPLRASAAEAWPFLIALGLLVLTFLFQRLGWLLGVVLLRGLVTHVSLPSVVSRTGRVPRPTLELSGPRRSGPSPAGGSVADVRPTRLDLPLTCSSGMCRP